jgi:type IV secretory pathway VirB2 component (pilin)
MVIKIKLDEKIMKVLLMSILLLLRTHFAFAEATSESDLQSFLEGVGDFLIRIVGPAVLVIGIGISGVSMALGDEQGMRRGALAAGGGALILLSRAVLDFIQNITRF